MSKSFRERFDELRARWAEERKEEDRKERRTNPWSEDDEEELEMLMEQDWIDAMDPRD